jgi:hypothetical protein
LERYAHHQCRTPQRHELFASLARMLWMLTGGLYLVPKIVFAWSHSGVWAFVSIALSLTVGNVTITTLANWRCQPVTHRRTLGPLLYLAHVAWALRKSLC